MRDERFEVTVTFDERRGYIASAPELRQPVVVLSLGGLRKRIEIALLSDDVALQLDGLAEANATAARRSWRAEPGIRACTHLWTPRQVQAVF
jgi:hypothetical protein